MKIYRIRPEERAKASLARYRRQKKLSRLGAGRRLKGMRTTRSFEERLEMLGAIGAIMTAVVGATHLYSAEIHLDAKVGGTSQSRAEILPRKAIGERPTGRPSEVDQLRFVDR